MQLAALETFLCCTPDTTSAYLVMEEDGYAATISSSLEFPGCQWNTAYSSADIILEQ